MILDADALPDDVRDLLHELRLRGLVTDAPDAVAAQLCERGLAHRQGTSLALTSEGRLVHAAWARYEEGSDAHLAARTAYDQFRPLNAALLRLSTDWQVRGGNVPNDHSDPSYDWSVIDRLVELDERAGPVVRRLAKAVHRFEEYRPRLSDAVRLVLAGEHAWFVSPRCDSYHTVWMQLHEDLLLALGLERPREDEERTAD